MTTTSTIGRRDAAGTDGRGRSAGSGETRITRRRLWRPQWALLGVLLVLGGALAFVAVSTSLDERQAVLAANRSIAAGELLRASDLRSVDVALSGSGVPVVAAANATEIVGAVTTGPLDEGELLSPGDVAARRSLEPGMAIVGAVLGPGAAPVSTLQPGELVNVIATAAEGAGAPTGQLLTTGSVYAIEPLRGSSVGGWVVSLAVPADAQASVAAAAAGDRLRLTLAADGSRANPAAAPDDGTRDG